jgi:hypothetical protein
MDEDTLYGTCEARIHVLISLTNIRAISLIKMAGQFHAKKWRTWIKRAEYIFRKNAMAD